MFLFLTILHNPVPCGADGLLGDAHDTAHVLIFHAHFVEDEEEGVNLYYLIRISPNFFVPLHPQIEETL